MMEKLSGNLYCPFPLPKMEYCVGKKCMWWIDYGIDKDNDSIGTCAMVALVENLNFLAKKP